MGIQELKKNNQYPIIFVGSGISKRYIKNSPDWLSLLKEYWEKLDEDTNFYSFLTKIKEKELNDDNKDDINFIVNAKAASIIQKKFDEKYLLQNNLVPNLTPEKVYREGISPFKFSLSKRFSSLDYLENMSSELKEFTKVIKKSRMVITTNYDCLIEDLIGKNSENIDLFIGGEGFFRQTTSWNELYKIHGSISDPNSLIITENDYKKFEYDSIILNAKLLTSLVDSPIIFIGYSLSDKNIRSLLQEYSKNIPTNVSKMADRITVVEYEPNISSLEENIEHDQELGITYNRITTDNYLSLFENISKINQGVSPAFIKKYQKQFKNIIDVKGRSGELDTFLTYASNIDSLPEDYKNRNTAIAIGEQGTLFMVPNIVDYLNDYLLDKQKISLQISIKFLNNQTSGAQIPYKKIIDELNSSNDITLTTKDKLRIDKRIESTRTLECQINAIKINIKDKYFLSKSIHEIWNSKELKEINKIKLISKTIKNHPKDIENFILQEALPQFTELYNSGAKSNGVHSAYRKLFVMYDLYKNGNIDTTIK